MSAQGQGGARSFRGAQPGGRRRQGPGVGRAREPAGSAGSRSGSELRGLLENVGFLPQTPAEARAGVVVLIVLVKTSLLFIISSSVSGGRLLLSCLKIGLERPQDSLRRCSLLIRTCGTVRRWGGTSPAGGPQSPRGSGSREPPRTQELRGVGRDRPWGRRHAPLRREGGLRGWGRAGAQDPRGCRGGGRRAPQTCAWAATRIPPPAGQRTPALLLWGLKSETEGGQDAWTPGCADATTSPRPRDGCLVARPLWTDCCLWLRWVRGTGKSPGSKFLCSPLHGGRPGAETERPAQRGLHPTFFLPLPLPLGPSCLPVPQPLCPTCLFPDPCPSYPLTPSPLPCPPVPTPPGLSLPSLQLLGWKLPDKPGAQASLSFHLPGPPA